MLNLENIKFWHDISNQVHIIWIISHDLHLAEHVCLVGFFSDEIHNWEGISRLCENGLSPQIFLRRNCVHLHVIIWQCIFIAVGARVSRSHFDYVYVGCFKMRYYYRWCSVMPLTSILTILTNRILKSVDSTGRLGSPTLGRSSAMYLVIYTKTPISQETDNH